MPAQLSDEEIRSRFFTNLSKTERLAVFEVFGVFPGGSAECPGHDAEEHLLHSILARGVQGLATSDGELSIFCYTKEVHPGWREYNKIDEFSSGQSGGEALVKLADARAAVAAARRARERNHASLRMLTEAELRDPEYMRSYVEEMQATLSEVLASRAAVARAAAGEPPQNGEVWRAIDTAMPTLKAFHCPALQELSKGDKEIFARAVMTADRSETARLQHSNSVEFDGIRVHPASLLPTARAVHALRELAEVAQAVISHEDDGRRSDAPGHCHRVPGVWDLENKPEIAGKPCDWCATWTRFKHLVGAASAAISGAACNAGIATGREPALGMKPLALAHEPVSSACGELEQRFARWTPKTLHLKDLSRVLAAVRVQAVAEDRLDRATEQVTLNGHQIKLALELSWPDGDGDPAQGETRVTISRHPAGEAADENGETLKMPAGLYLTFDAHPEDGMALLPESSEALPPGDSPPGGSPTSTPRRDILGICDAYESGVGHGLQRDGLKSGSIFADPQHAVAYELGYKEGERRADAADADSARRTAGRNGR